MLLPGPGPCRAGSPARPPACCAHTGCQTSTLSSFLSNLHILSIPPLHSFCIVLSSSSSSIFSLAFFFLFQAHDTERLSTPPHPTSTPSRLPLIRAEDANWSGLHRASPGLQTTISLLDLSETAMSFAGRKILFDGCVLTPAGRNDWEEREQGVGGGGEGGGEGEEEELTLICGLCGRSFLLRGYLLQPGENPIKRLQRDTWERWEGEARGTCLICRISALVPSLIHSS